MTDSSPLLPNQRGAQGAAQVNATIPDKVLMYACIFSYEPSKELQNMLSYQVNINVIEQYESKWPISLKF